MARSMKDADCIAFLQWALPRLDMRWAGFRKVRRQVCRRIARRMTELGLDGYDQYRAMLHANPDEWPVLDAACRVTISRFYRDKNVFDRLGRDILPNLAARARGDKRPVRCWSAGCASGEEAYTLTILWDRAIATAHPTVALEIVATDTDPHMIERAKNACYPPGSLKDLPAGWLDAEFTASGDTFCVDPRHRGRMTFLMQDIREQTPPGRFDLVLCRNLVFTYFNASLQNKVLDAITNRLHPDGYLVIGAHERLPPSKHDFGSLDRCAKILQYRGEPKRRACSDHRAGGRADPDALGPGQTTERGYS